MKKNPKLSYSNFLNLDIKTDIFINSVFLLKWYLPAYKVSIFFCKNQTKPQTPHAPINPTKTIHSAFQSTTAFMSVL